MSANASPAIVLSVTTHPAALRRLASRAALVPAQAETLPSIVPWVEAPLSDEVDARLAIRRSRLVARDAAALRHSRVLSFRALIPFHTLWRRWRRGVPLSRLWCAPARLSGQPCSPFGELRQLKRSPRPAGTHRLRDLSANACRRRPLARGTVRQR